MSRANLAQALTRHPVLMDGPAAFRRHDARQRQGP